MDHEMETAMATLDAGMQARLTTMLVGPPGVGKTAVLRQKVKQMDGYKFISLMGSQMDPSDVAGFPKGEQLGVDENGRPLWGTTYLMPWWQIEILTYKKVVLFLDEYSNATPAVRAAMLVILQDREFPNGMKIPDETIIVGALNPPEESPTGYEMDLPTGNRLLLIRWIPTNQYWFEGMLKGWGDKLSPQEMVWKKKVVEFLKKNPDLIHKMPDSTKPVNTSLYSLDQTDHSGMFVFNTAWPSHRSWDHLTKALAVASADPHVQDRIARGLVGAAAALKFREWLQSNDTLDVDAILEDPFSVDWAKMSLDNGHVLFRGLTNMITEENATNVLQVFIAAGQAGRKDIASPYIKSAVKAALSNHFSAKAIATIKPVAQKLVAVFKS